MTHKWVNYHYLVMNGHIRTNGIAHPRRERVAVRKALASLGFRYKELVPFLNPDYRGWKEKEEGSIQWLDFCVWSGKRMFVVMFEVTKHAHHAYHLEAWAAKKRLLEDKNIPYLVVSKTHTSQVYNLLISKFVRKENL